MQDFILNWRVLMLDNISNVILFSIFFFYIGLRIIGRIEQKRLKLDNFEWWAYRSLTDMYRNQGYPYPELSARDKINEIIKEYKRAPDTDADYY